MMTTLAAGVLAADEVHVALWFPSVLFPIIALATFGALGIVTWSFRDVANRHAKPEGAHTPQAPSH